MRELELYWYWPFPHRGDNALAQALLQPGDHLTVHSLASRFGERITGTSELYDIRRELPEPKPHRHGSPQWFASRGATYAERAIRRSHVVRRGHFDICHVHSLNYLIDGIALSSLDRRAALVSSVNDVVPHERRIPERIERALLSLLYERAGQLVVYHERLRAQLRDLFGIPPERVSVVPHPVAAVDPPPDRALLRGQPTVLFFGTFRRNKGVPILLEAIRQLDGMDDVRFVLAGRGNSELERMVGEASLSDHRIEADIRYIEHHERDQLYRRADVVVLPYTHFASQSGVLADAYAYHVPVVVTDVGAVGETVREDATGWVVPPNDAGALAVTLRTALADAPGLRAAEHAAARAAQLHGYQAVGAQLRAIYEGVLAYRR
jgi:glycosyltransferase involved in cell wall biosynthesis